MFVLFSVLVGYFLYLVSTGELDVSFAPMSGQRGSKSRNDGSIWKDDSEKSRHGEQLKE